MIKNVDILSLYDIKMNGAIFCQVIKIRQFLQLNPSITPGNQKWKGAAPIFIKRADGIKYITVLCQLKSIILDKSTAARNRIDAIA